MSSLRRFASELIDTARQVASTIFATGVMFRSDSASSETRFVTVVGLLLRSTVMNGMKMLLASDSCVLRTTRDADRSGADLSSFASSVGPV